MCKCNPAGPATRMFEPLKAPKFPLKVVLNFTASLTSPRCYGSTLSPGLPTLLVRKTESMWASCPHWLLSPLSPPPRSIFFLSSEHAASPPSARCLEMDWDGEEAHTAREVGRRRSERGGKGKPEGERKKGRIEQKEREAILRTCDTLIINKLRLNA